MQGHDNREVGGWVWCSVVGNAPRDKPCSVCPVKKHLVFKTGLLSRRALCSYSNSSFRHAFCTHWPHSLRKEFYQHVASHCHSTPPPPNNTAQCSKFAGVMLQEHLRIMKTLVLRQKTYRTGLLLWVCWRVRTLTCHLQAEGKQEGAWRTTATCSLNIWKKC